MGGSDASVRGTNDDAQLSKLSCVRLGYFRDDFVHLFVPHPARRSPLINRGYYSRFAALRDLLLRFLAAAGAPAQVLSLGAGYDTACFQLAREGVAPSKWVELDFLEVAQQKAAAIQKLPQLLEALSGAEIAIEEGRVMSDRYCLLPADLRSLPALGAALAAASFDCGAPTFVLSECVLVYMEPGESSALVRWLAARLPTAALAVYEQIRPDDAFGRQMLLNLASRGCPLRGISGTPSLEAHARRLRDCGWQRAEARSMGDIYRSGIDPADRRRIERLEIFDEFEEWDLIQAHYCIAVGVNDAAGILEGYALPRYQAQPLHGRLPLG